MILLTKNRGGTMGPYRIMVVDDSAFMRKIVSDLIEQDPSFKVESTARNGFEAVEKIADFSPDLVTMDVEMPDMNGLEALKIIMERHPLPVIMLSGINEQGTRETIMALELGAFDFIRKPSASTSSHDIEQVGRDLREQIAAAMLMKERRAAREAIQLREKELLSSIPQELFKPLTPLKSRNVPSVVKKPVKTDIVRNGGTTKKVDSQEASVHKPLPPSSRRKSDESLSKTNPILAEVQDYIGQIVGRTSKKDKPDLISQRTRQELTKKMNPSDLLSSKEESKDMVVRNEIGPSTHTTFTDLVAIGTSTGGPKALKVVLEKIPADFPAPIVIVQHMPANFTKSLAQRLNSLCSLNVVEAEEGMELLTGTAYIAPGGFHINVIKGHEGRHRLTLSKQELRNGHRPSVDVLYESLRPLHALKRHIVLLTGMGSDGAKVMKQLYDDGVTSTIAESEETCVVYGMPRSAIELKCVTHVLPLHEIGPKLVQVVK